MKIVKRNGRKVNVSFDKVLYRIRKLVSDKNLGPLKYTEPDIVAQDVIKNIYDGVKTSELDEMAGRIAVSLTSTHYEYDKLASRIIISNMHKNTTECFSDSMETLFANKSGDTPVPLVSEAFIKVVRENKDKLNFAIDYNRDYLFDYFGYKTLERSYLLKVKTEKEHDDDNGMTLVERPQHMWMRVSLGLHLDNIDRAIETYELMSTMYFTHASPTLFNSGTNRPACSSCFLLGIEDSMAGIYKCLADCAETSKHAGGIGIHIGNIRSKGTYIKGTNGYSDGIVKMLKVFNETARYANQGSKRNGSFAIYLETFHADIYEFLELRKNTGADHLRARDLFYALWVNDAFMTAVENDTDWYLMSMDECPGLTDVYGEDFDKLYYSYVEQKKYRKVVKARDLWQKILVSQIETGMPYMSYKDAVNKKCNQKNIGTVKSSNLCVAPETLILTDTGYHRISDLENQEVNVWNGSQFSKTTVLKTGVDQPLIEVQFSNGMSLYCTEYHKFHIKNGSKSIIVQANNLVNGSELIDCEYPLIEGNISVSKTPYLDGVNKTNIPLNGTIEDRIKWITGMIDNSNSVFVDYSGNLNVGYIQDKEVVLLFQTLGCVVNYSKSNISIPPTSIKKLVELGFNKNGYLDLSRCFGVNVNKVTIVSVITTNRKDTTYCFNEPINHTGIFNGVITGNCNEITLVSNEKETAVCNICTFSLPKYIKKNSEGVIEFDHDKLYDVVKIATRNMNNVIDINYYPTKEAELSNKKHRPIAMGIQGLANLFFEFRIAFESDLAIKLNKEIMETIQYAGWTASMELAKERGETYSSYEGSPISQGLFQHNMWGVQDNELSGRWDWELLRKNIKEYGVLNSMITALPPTAGTSQILGNYESFEPINNNIFMRQTLSGNFAIINKYLIDDLVELKLWDEEMKDLIIAAEGSIQNIPTIPVHIKEIYKNIWEIPQKHLINMSRDRGLFVDQTQSLNIFIAKPTIAKLSAMHFYGWKAGLKTGMYYLRSKPASKPKQMTVSKEIEDKTKINSSKQDEEALVCSLDNKEACVSCTG